MSPAVFRVTGPYLNLLVKIRFFSGFSGKNIILCILKVKCLSKYIELYFFPEKEIITKNMCAYPT